MGSANSRLPNDEETDRNPSIPPDIDVVRRGRQEEPLTSTQRLMLEDPLLSSLDRSLTPESRPVQSSERQGRRIMRRTRQFLRNNRENETRGSRDDSPFPTREVIFRNNRRNQTRRSRNDTINQTRRSRDNSPSSLSTDSSLFRSGDDSQSPSPTRQFLRNNRGNETRGSRDDSPFPTREVIFRNNRINQTRRSRNDTINQTRRSRDNSSSPFSNDSSSFDWSFETRGSGDDSQSPSPTRQFLRNNRGNETRVSRDDSPFPTREGFFRNNRRNQTRRSRGNSPSPFSTRHFQRINRINRRRRSRDDSPDPFGDMVGFTLNNTTNDRDGVNVDDDLSRLRSELVAFENVFEALIQQYFEQGGSAVSSSSCPPASVSALERLPLMIITEHDFEDEATKECCICFSEFSVGDEVSRLPCGHIFHKECIAKWLRKKCTCPQCRWELETEDERFEVERRQRMKSRKIKVKDHELDRLCIEALQDMAGTRDVTSRKTLIETIRSSDHVDVMT